MSHRETSPFHRGEQSIQARVGVREKVEKIGRRFIRDHMPDEHRAFYEQLPFLLFGSVDEGGRPWASILAGPPGFVRTPDERTLDIAAVPFPGDPAGERLEPGAAVGLLGIEFENRRRNRVNGRVSRRDAGSVTIAVDQSFGNCPMYIQARTGSIEQRAGEPAPPEHLTSIDESVGALIAGADSFFIATHFAGDDDGPTTGADVSHRGGRPGFVRVADDGSLIWPDFTGNTHFNTLGNILLNPRAGLLFIDYDSGDLITLTGSAEIIWDGDELEHFTGAERLVRFRLDEGRRLRAAMPMRWDFQDYSPVLDQTGTWEEAETAIAARDAGNTWREYTVTRVVEESRLIRSFYLESSSGEDPPGHVAGQFLPLELYPDGHDGPVRRTYTISNAPNGAHLRLSIKREDPPSADLPPGLSSVFFHDEVGVGTTLRALDPRGCFRLDSESCRPVVLISAGVGVTPMLAMLEQLVRDRGHCGPRRAIYFVHGARSGSEHAFADAVRGLAAETSDVRVHVAYSNPSPDDVEGRDFDSTGRVGIPLLQSLLPFGDYDFYVCGPTAFMTDIYDGLRALNIDEGRIHYEFFGPAAKLGDGAEPGAIATLPEDAATEPVPVRFARSGVDTLWDPSRGTLLDLAESEGLTPPYSCRSGICQTCATDVSGNVSYAQAPMAPPPSGQALICCAWPKPGDGEEPLILGI